VEDVNDVLDNDEARPLSFARPEPVPAAAPRSTSSIVSPHLVRRLAPPQCTTADDDDNGAGTGEFPLYVMRDQMQRGSHASLAPRLPAVFSFVAPESDATSLCMVCRDVLAEQRKRNPEFAFAKDGIHPDAFGHWVMARAILTGLGITDISSTPDATSMMSGIPQGADVLKLIQKQQSITKDAWLTATGHKRPMKTGLPLDQAQQRAAEIEKQLQPLLPVTP
jgi:hypothetical protein